MKRYTLTTLVAIAALLSAYCSFADKIPASKLYDEAGIVKVSDVMGMKEGKSIWLQGNITRKIDKDHYAFKDDTGEIRIRIPKMVLKGNEIPTDQTIKIFGKIEKNDFISRKRNIPPEIKVKKIEIVEEKESQAESKK